MYSIRSNKSTLYSGTERYRSFHQVRDSALFNRSASLTRLSLRSSCLMPNWQLPQHERFRLVVRSGEYACPDGNTRRSLRFVEVTRARQYTDAPCNALTYRPLLQAQHTLRAFRAQVTWNQRRTKSMLLSLICGTATYVPGM